jgi:hypothetical protein
MSKAQEKTPLFGHTCVHRVSGSVSIQEALDNTHHVLYGTCDVCDKEFY